MSTEVAQLPSATPDQTVKPWSTPRVIAFRALFCFFILIDFPFPMSLFPGIQRLLFWYETAYLALSVWVGKSIFHLKYISTARNGSGDKTTDYLALFCIVVITLVATLIWSIVDRKRRHYTTLFEFLTVYVRFALAVALISYGMYKIVPSQFPAPTLAALTETYGESSPMHLLWTFMGFSPAYNVFAGSCELLAGLLLMSRRTTPLGSAIAAAVLLNIVMLNFCYDVPVKIYSCELLAQALFLLAPHMHRLAAVFVLNRRAEPVLLAPRFTRRSLKIAHFVLKACLISFVLFTTARQSVAQRSRMQSVLLKPPLYGLYEVQKIAFIGAGSSGAAEPNSALESDRLLLFGFRSDKKL